MDTNVQATPRVNYVHPERLIEGEDYLWLEAHHCGSHAVRETVRFVGYAPCPATVIVQDARQQRISVARHRLYSLDATLPGAPLLC